LQDTAAVNTTRWARFHRLEVMGLSVATGNGGGIKWNRARQSILMSHGVAKACVRASTSQTLSRQHTTPLRLVATGRHSRQMGHLNAFGMPDTVPKSSSAVRGMRTGNGGRAVAPATSITVGT
jgi:hypothetical protein